MHILYTESSTGWGGQEIRILKEAMGLRQRGYHISFAVMKGAKLADHARQQGFEVLELGLEKWKAVPAIIQLCLWIYKNKVDIVSTHSSSDAWLGGLAARLTGKGVVRTRHLSTPNRKGLNSYLLYHVLADYVVTTCSSIIADIQRNARLSPDQIECVATGVELFQVSPIAVSEFRKSLKIKESDILIGSVCVVRSWKGIQDMIEAARLLKKETQLKWIVIGGGYIEHFKPLVESDLPFIFTGHLDDPKVACASLDIFMLLSTAHEGISQASLQAAFLKKPLITTDIGGLPEVCLDGITGLVVSPHAPRQVAEAVLKLAQDISLRGRLGHQGHALVISRYTYEQMLDRMEAVFKKVYSKRKS